MGIRNKRITDTDNPDDVRRIIIALSQEGYYMTPREAEELWLRYSRSQGDAWTALPASDTDLQDILIRAINAF